MICCDYIITIKHSVFYFNYTLYVTLHYNVNEAPINIVIHCVMYSLVINKRRNKINNDFCESNNNTKYGFYFNKAIYNQISV